MVAALVEHHDEFVRPMGSWPQHITILPWMEGYPHQAIYRMNKAIAGSGAIRATVSGVDSLGADSAEKAWVLESDALHELRKKIADAALRNGTEYVEPAHSPYLSHVTMREGQPELTLDEEITIHELSVLSWIHGGLIVRKNILLGAADETTA